MLEQHPKTHSGRPISFSCPTSLPQLKKNNKQTERKRREAQVINTSKNLPQQLDNVPVFFVIACLQFSYVESTLGQCEPIAPPVHENIGQSKQCPMPTIQTITNTVNTTQQHSHSTAMNRQVRGIHMTGGPHSQKTTTGKQPNKDTKSTSKLSTKVSCRVEVFFFSSIKISI